MISYQFLKKKKRKERREGGRKKLREKKEAHWDFWNFNRASIIESINQFRETCCLKNTESSNS